MAVPSPGNSTTVQRGPDPTHGQIFGVGTVSVVPPIYPYVQTSNGAIFTPSPVSGRATSQPLYGPSVRKVGALSWLPTYTQPSRAVAPLMTVGMELSEPVLAVSQWAFSEFDLGYFNMMLFNG